ncbi:hypothetical protein A6R68_21802, partial [Neotoma lepida]
MAICCIQYFLPLFLLGLTSYSDALVCKKGVMVIFGSGFAKTAVNWTAPETKIAAPGESCHETLLLIDIGPKSLLVGSKGSGIDIDEDTRSETVDNYNYGGGDVYPDNGTTLMYADGPGILAALYHENCFTDLCNKDEDTEILVKNLHVVASYQSKSLKCPVCLQYQGSCPTNFVFCPKNTGCYAGDIAVKGGGINANFSIKGCLDVTTENIFKRDDALGIFTMLEHVTSMTANSFSHLFVPVTSLAW